MSGAQSQRSAQGERQAGPSKRAKGKKAAPVSAETAPTAGPNTTTSSSAAGATPGGAKKNRSRKKKKKKDNVAGGGTGKEDEGKQRLKVVVRRLPPNLPEHIFWNSVEPWTGKQELPPPKQVKSITIASAQTGSAEAASAQVSANGSQTEVVKAANELESSDASGTDKTAVGTPQSQTAPTEGKASESSASAQPTKSGPLVNLGSAGQGKLLWRRYVTGKFKSGPSSSNSAADPSNPHVHSRAYLRFKALQDLLDFHRGFDGHVFRDAKGNESVALVEWAPYQKVPSEMTQPASKKRDKRRGTIEQDEDYIAFVEQLKNGDGKDPKDKPDGELLGSASGTISKEEAAAAALQAAKNTPLLEHLRSKKAAKAAKKGKDKAASAKASASGKKGPSKAEAKALKAARGYLKTSVAGYGAQTEEGSSNSGTVKSTTAKAKAKAKEREQAAEAASTNVGKTSTNVTQHKTASKVEQSGKAIPTGPKNSKGKQGAKEKIAPTHATGEANSTGKGRASEPMSSEAAPPSGPKKQRQPPKKSKQPSAANEGVGAPAPAILQRSSTPKVEASAVSGTSSEAVVKGKSGKRGPKAGPKKGGSGPSPAGDS